MGVSHRLTSVANPHVNCSAEIAVKTVKRMLMDNSTPSGSIDVDKFQKSTLVYRNSIDPDRDGLSETTLGWGGGGIRTHFTESAKMNEITTE